MLFCQPWTGARISGLERGACRMARQPPMTRPLALLVELVVSRTPPSPVRPASAHFACYFLPCPTNAGQSAERTRQISTRLCSPLSPASLAALNSHFHASMDDHHVRLPINVFYRRSRLAAPPLVGDWPADQVRQFVANVGTEDGALEILHYFYNKLKPLCEGALAATARLQLSEHGPVPGSAETDTQWLRRILTHLQTVFESVLERGAPWKRIAYAEALLSKLRAGIEMHPDKWQEDARTVSYFILSTVRTVKDQASSQGRVDEDVLVRRGFFSPTLLQLEFTPSLLAVAQACLAQVYRRLFPRSSWLARSFIDRSPFDGRPTCLRGGTTAATPRAAPGGKNWRSCRRATSCGSGSNGARGFAEVGGGDRTASLRAPSASLCHSGGGRRRGGEGCLEDDGCRTGTVRWSSTPLSGTGS